MPLEPDNKALSPFVTPTCNGSTLGGHICCHLSYSLSGSNCAFVWAIKVTRTVWEVFQE